MSKLLLVMALCLGSALIGAGPNGEAYESHADNAVIPSNRGNQGCTNLGCPHLGLMASLLLMNIQWVGLTRRVGQWRKGKAGAYKTRRNFALVFLLLVVQAEKWL